VVVVETVQDPHVPPAHPSDERAPRPELRFVVTDAWKLVRISQRGYRREYRAESGRVWPQAELDDAPTERRAQPRDSSGHGDSPVAAQCSS
jgi:hypothetical protein